MSKITYANFEAYEKATKKKRLMKTVFKAACTAIFTGTISVALAQHFILGDPVDEYTDNYINSHTNEEQIVTSDIETSDTPYISPYVFTDDNVAGYLASDVLPQVYPVAVPTENNQQYYLNHNLSGQEDANGTIYMDYRNYQEKTDFEDQVTVIYGHNMLSGAMFGNLNKYSTPGFYEEHKAFTYYTREGAYELEVFAGNVMDGTEVMNDVNAYPNEEAFLNDIASVRANSDFHSDVTIEGDDKVVAFITCADGYNSKTSDNRYILFAKVKPLTYVNDMGVVCVQESSQSSLSI